MTAPKLEHKENTRPKIKRIETTHKSVKALHNFICGIDFILLEVASIAVQNGMKKRNCCGYAVGYGIGSDD